MSIRGPTRLIIIAKKVLSRLLPFKVGDAAVGCYPKEFIYRIVLCIHFLEIHIFHRTTTFYQGIG